MNRIRNEYVRRTARVKRIKHKVSENNIGLNGLVLRRKNNCGKSIMKIAKWRRKRLMDAERNDMKVVGLVEEDAMNCKRKRKMIYYNDL